MTSSSPSPSVHFRAELVNGTWLAASFVVTLLTPWVVIASGNGTGVNTMSGYAFKSPALDPAAAAVPPDATLAAYAAYTSVWSGSVKSELFDASGDAIVTSWMQGAEGPTVRWISVGVAEAVGSAWTAARTGAVMVGHTSLQTDRQYVCGVVSAGDPSTAVARVSYRVPGPSRLLSTDDGLGDFTNNATFHSGPLALPANASGFVRAVDLRTDTPPATACAAKVTVVAPPGRGDRAPRVFTLPFFNNGEDYTTWRSLLFPSPLAVAGGSVVTVSHSCGGQTYPAAVRKEDGAAVVAMRVDLLGA